MGTCDGRETPGSRPASVVCARRRGAAHRVGSDTIGHRGLSAAAALDGARAHGLDGVQCLEPAAIIPDLDAGGLAAFRLRTEALGLYPEVGPPSPNPVRRPRAEGRPVEAAEHARERRRHVAAVAAPGCRRARASVGDRHDRFRTGVPWEAQRAAPRDVLRHLAPCLRVLGMRIAPEAHADLTTEELIKFLDVLGPDVAGMTLVTGNLW
jgi:3-oxoisoapionate decarboxylase